MAPAPMTAAAGSAASSRPPAQLPVTLVLGPPSPGKTHLLQQLAQHPGCRVLVAPNQGCHTPSPAATAAVQPTLTASTLQQLASAAAAGSASAAVLAASPCCNPWEVAAWFQDTSSSSCHWDLLEGLTGEVDEEHDHHHHHHPHPHDSTHHHEHPHHSHQQQQQPGSPRAHHSNGHGTHHHHHHSRPGSSSSSSKTRRLVDATHLAAVVVVVEASHLLQHLSSTSTAAQVGWVTPEHPAAGSYVALLLGAQLEAADIIILSAVETVPPLALPLLQQVVGGFSSRAAVVLAGAYDTPPPQQLLGQRLHSYEAAAAGPVWVGVSQTAGAAAQQYQQQLLQAQPLTTASTAAAAAAAAAGDACTNTSSRCTVVAAGQTPDRAAGGGGGSNLCSWVFTARLPFHPGRLHTWLTQHFLVTQPGDTPGDAKQDAAGTQAAAAARCRQAYGHLLTSHGVVWLLGRERTAGEWVQVGPVLQLGPGEPWSPAAGAGPGAEAAGAGSSMLGGVQPNGGEAAAGSSNWAPGVGTRRQEVVFVGYDLQVPALNSSLVACLATWEEVGAWYADHPPPAATVSAAGSAAAAAAGSSSTGEVWLPWSDDEEEEEEEEDLDEGQEEEEGGSEERLAGHPVEDVPTGPAPTAAAAALAGGAPSVAPGAAAAGHGTVHDDAADAADAEADVQEPPKEPAPALVWHPGRVTRVTHGAPQLQQLLEDVADAWSAASSAPNSTTTTSSSSTSSSSNEPGAWVLVEWYAPWAAASQTASQQLAALAAGRPGLVCVSVDVAASSANEQLAFEKVMERAQAWRKGGRTFHHVLKSGEKWPAASLLLAPSMQPLQAFEGAGAAAGLVAALGDKPVTQRDWLSDAGLTAVGEVQDGQPSSSSNSDDHVDGQRPSAAAAGAAGVALPPPRVVTRGAADLKAALAAAGTAPVLLAWATPSTAATTNSSSSSSSSGRTPATTTTGAGAEAVTAAELEAFVLAAAAAAAASPPSSSSTSTPSSSQLRIGAAVRVGGWLLADPAASAANQQLAAALRVGSALPLVQVYGGNRVAASVKVGAAGAQRQAAVEKLAAALRSAAAASAAGDGAAGGPAAGGGPGGGSSEEPRGAATATTTASSSRSSSGALELPASRGTRTPQAAGTGGMPGAAVAAGASAAATAAGGKPAAEAAAPGGRSAATGASTAAVAAAEDKASNKGPAKPAAQAAAAAAGTATGPSLWDPPSGKAAKPGAKKRLGPTGRIAVYWPRMPCLECGCPWWFGEDWDAECGRCGWSCEEGGYDDDSNPLPAYQARWQEIQQALQQGRTPAWAGK